MGYVSPSQAQRTEEVRARIRSLRKKDNLGDDAYSFDHGHKNPLQSPSQATIEQQHNNSLQLPELKSITPVVSNVKNYYEQMNGGS